MHMLRRSMQMIGRLMMPVAMMPVAMMLVAMMLVEMMLVEMMLVEMMMGERFLASLPRSSLAIDNARRQIDWRIFCVRELG